MYERNISIITRNLCDNQFNRLATINANNFPKIVLEIMTEVETQYPNFDNNAKQDIIMGSAKKIIERFFPDTNQIRSRKTIEGFEDLHHVGHENQMARSIYQNMVPGLILAFKTEQYKKTKRTRGYCGFCF